MVGICHLTDSHHNHHGQKPTMVGICHGGNMLGNHHHHHQHQYQHHLPRAHTMTRVLTLYAKRTYLRETVKLIPPRHYYVAIERICKLCGSLHSRVLLLAVAFSEFYNTVN